MTESLNGFIASTSNVTINGGGALTLTGNNTLRSVTFNNNGSTTTPSVVPTGILLVANGTIAANSDNAGSVATLGAGTLQFGNNTPTFNVTSATTERLATDLLVNSVVANTFGFGWQIAANGTNPLVKTGNGAISFGGLNSFPNGVNLNQGTLVVSAAATTTANGVVSSASSAPAR